MPVGLQSLLVQCTAVLLTAVFHFLLQGLVPHSTALLRLALIQGVIAAVLSLGLRQPAWWPPLHFGFMPAVVLAQQANVPAWVYLAAFLLLVLFYWSSFRTRVPLYLSGRPAWEATASLLPQGRSFRFIDLGSGLGGVPFHLAPRFPHGVFYGTEVAPAPWFISRVRAWLAGSRVRFMRRDYASLDLGDFDVVFAFLSPAAMPGLWQQAHAQMRSGSLLVSLAFAVDGRQPDHVIEPPGGTGHSLFAWRM